MTQEQFEKLKKGQSIYIINVEGLFEYKITKDFHDGYVVATNMRFRLNNCHIKEEECGKFYDSAEGATSSFRANSNKLFEQAKAETLRWFKEEMKHDKKRTRKS